MATALSPTVVLTSNPRATLHLSSSKTGQTRDTVAIQFRDCYNGIGIKVIGGTVDGVPHGIFIKRLLKDGKALTDGRLKVGDQVLRINGQSLENISYSNSLQILREAAATGQATLVVTRDAKSGREFNSLMDDELTTASESSRATTPLNAMESSRSSESTLQSEGSPSQHPNPKNNQLQLPHAMNNSSLTRSLSNNSANRQDIKRLANFFTHKLHGAATMASTPYDELKESNQNRGLGNAEPATGMPGHQEAADSLFAQQLLTSIHPGSQQSSLRRGASLQLAPPLQPDMRCSYEKLDTALRFLGIHITEAQRAQLRSMLNVDSQGLISYGQFVQVVKNMFQDDLKQWDTTSLRESGVETLSPTRTTATLSSTHLHKPSVSAEVNMNNQDLVDEIRQLQKENFALRKQIHNVCRQLNEQCQLTSGAEKDLHKFRLESQQALDETASLREKLLLAAESQKIASQQEQEFERVIDGLEQEITLLKENESKQMESTAVRKKLAVLGAQLRKSEDSRKTYQVATQKLLEYCQCVHDTMTGQATVQTRLTPQHMASEALETMALVRTLLERDPLPFGWEECFDEEGARYFINHVTQETSWQHPITRQASSSNKRIY